MSMLIRFYQRIFFNRIWRAFARWACECLVPVGATVGVVLWRKLIDTFWAVRFENSATPGNFNMKRLSGKNHKASLSVLLDISSHLSAWWVRIQLKYLTTKRVPWRQERESLKRGLISQTYTLINSPKGKCICNSTVDSTCFMEWNESCARLMRASIKQKQA